MKLLTLSLMATMIIGTSAFAEEATTSTDKPANVVSEITKKKDRKKKVEMCAECGKPESECDCHGHDKKEEKKSSEEGN